MSSDMENTKLVKGVSLIYKVPEMILNFCYLES